MKFNSFWINLYRYYLSTNSLFISFNDFMVNKEFQLFSKKFNNLFQMKKIISTTDNNTKALVKTNIIPKTIVNYKSNKPKYVYPTTSIFTTDSFPFEASPGILPHVNVLVEPSKKQYIKSKIHNALIILNQKKLIY